MGAGAHVILNGALLPRSQARLHPDDRGFLLGDGVFETVRLYDGTPLLLDAHLRRLADSCRAVELQIPWSAAEITAWVSTLVDRNALRRGSGRLRLTVSRGAAATGSADTPTALVTADPYAPPDAQSYAHGVEVEIAAPRRRASPWHQVKSTSYQSHLWLRRQARNTSTFDVLQWNDAGHLAEGTFTNVFVVDAQGVLRTPAPEDGCLRGVTRDAVLKLATDAGVGALEGGVTESEVASAQEMFLTGSLIEIVPVRQLDASAVGAACPGPLTLRLLRLYRDLVSTETGP